MMELGFGYQPFDSKLCAQPQSSDPSYGLRSTKDLQISILQHTAMASECSTGVPYVCQPPSLSLLDTQTTYPSLIVGFQPWNWVPTNGMWVKVNKDPNTPGHNTLAQRPTFHLLPAARCRGASRGLQSLESTRAPGSWIAAQNRALRYPASTEPNKQDTSLCGRELWRFWGWLLQQHHMTFTMIKTHKNKGK